MIQLTENPYPRINSGLPTNDFCYSQYDLAKAFDEGVKAQLKKVVEWGIDRRKHFEQKRGALKLEKPNDISGITILGAKMRAFQQVIDKCGQAPLEEVK